MRFLTEQAWGWYFLASLVGLLIVLPIVDMIASTATQYP